MRNHKPASGPICFPVLLGGLFLAAATLPAAASGGLECSAEDKSVRFGVGAGVTRGGGGTFNLKGVLEIFDEEIARDLRKITLVDADRPQFWLDGEDLRLGFYKERDAGKPFGSVRLEIRTRSTGDDETYKGTYKLSTFILSDSGEDKMAAFAGVVSCFVE